MVVHVTDGAPRDERYAQSKGFATREEYARARRREVASALGHVGITPERIRGLGYVDGEASLQLLELVFDIADLIDEVRPEIVLTHPYEGGHSDHDATAFAVHLACGILRRDKAPAPIVLMTERSRTFGVDADIADHSDEALDQALTTLMRRERDVVDLAGGGGHRLRIQLWRHPFEGLQATDLVLVFTNRDGFKGLLDGKVKLGVDAAVAAGPVGRDASASTDVLLKSPVLAYSRSKGLFAGISLDGAVVSIDDSANKKAYAKEVSAEDILYHGKVAANDVVGPFVRTLEKYSPARKRVTE